MMTFKENTEILKFFIEYLVLNEKRLKSFSDIENIIGTPRFRIVINRLLGWIRLRAKFKKEKNLEFKNERIFDDFKTIFEKCIELEKIFFLDGNVLKFQSTVSTKEIEDFVLENFVLKIRTSPAGITSEEE